MVGVFRAPGTLADAKGRRIRGRENGRGGMFRLKI